MTAGALRSYSSTLTSARPGTRESSVSPNLTTGRCCCSHLAHVSKPASCSILLTRSTVGTDAMTASWYVATVMDAGASGPPHSARRVSSGSDLSSKRLATLGIVTSLSVSPHAAHSDLRYRAGASSPARPSW